MPPQPRRRFSPLFLIQGCIGTALILWFVIGFLALNPWNAIELSDLDTLESDTPGHFSKSAVRVSANPRAAAANALAQVREIGERRLRLGGRAAQNFLDKVRGKAKSAAEGARGSSWWKGVATAYLESSVEAEGHSAFTYVNVSSNRLHGVVGIQSDGTKAWTPKPLPPKDQNIPLALRVGGGFNLELSDALPLDRDIPDARSSACRALTYTPDLPTASVVIVFYNEPFSTLFRSVHSVLNRTPQRLLDEIILVDDGSNLDWIKKSPENSNTPSQIDSYVALLPKTRLIRSPERKGIVSARMLGIRATKSPIFVILDSHIEVSQGWLEPVVSRIGEDKSAVVMPQIDGINPETFAPGSGGIGTTLGFLWKLIEHGFTPNAKSPAERRNAGPTDAISSPAMAGGLFAAHTKFFLEELGGYDENFQFWGTENLELSFRTWMCGGRLEGLPCSRVYHIFRKGGVGYSSPFDAVTKNKMRLLTVWMDEYADLAWRVIGQPHIDYGPTDYLKEFRKAKKCQSFEWFLKEVNPESEVLNLSDDVPYLGALKNIGSGLCLDTHYDDYPGRQVFLGPCTYDSQRRSSQAWMYFRRPKHIMPVTNDESCLGGKDKPDSTDWCDKQRGRWDVNDGQLKFLKTGKCLTVVGRDKLTFEDCRPGSPEQKWNFAKYTPPSVFTPPPLPGQRHG